MAYFNFSWDISPHLALQPLIQRFLCQTLTSYQLMLPKIPVIHLVMCQCSDKDMFFQTIVKQKNTSFKQMKAKLSQLKLGPEGIFKLCHIQRSEPLMVGVQVIEELFLDSICASQYYYQLQLNLHNILSSHLPSIFQFYQPAQ